MRSIKIRKSQLEFYQHQQYDKTKNKPIRGCQTYEKRKDRYIKFDSKPRYNIGTSC